MQRIYDKDKIVVVCNAKAGTGKTQLLKEIVSRLEAKKRYVAVTAPTGIAAHNADGVTIHSFIHLPLSPYLPGDDGLPDIPELELQYTPAATFPEPIWKNDTIKVTEKLKQVTSKWTFPSL